MTTVYLFPRFDDDTQLMWQAAVERGWTTYRGTPPKGTHAVVGETIIYGGVMWAERVAEQLAIPLRTPPKDWLLTLPPECVKRKIKIVSGLEAKSYQNTLFPRFLKSLEWKSIESRTYFSRDDLPSQLSDTELLLDSEVLPFEAEFRAFILNGAVQTITRYATDGVLDLGNPEWVDGAYKFLGFVPLADLPSGVVVDVGWTSKGWAVIEANPAWCSGMYGHDPQRVLDVVAASCS